ncbi:phosphatase PAP2 family protein [Planctomicrobium piriforme]|uniref:PAP2 superfamily protein n=1 Tax=Planctomicrobium piriforme TaxID=1576369 RepID=A0A1I3MKD2_9PLAN|nr:phosphatase PAP2 family protein [Planctomicrobium piriforme]SFI97478.1 PAP2 superfamily protein [Planctomicrobium piriforme]
MMKGVTDQTLLLRTLIALFVCTIAVVICYFWVDRPVAFFVERQQINKITIFKWLTFPPPWVQSWSPLVLTLLLGLGALRPLKRCQWTLVVACLSLLVADQFRTSIGDLCGRYWPETWFDHNPSLIGTGTYGFHPFVHGDDIGSFPSGHACRIVGFAAVWWHVYPRCRWLLLIICPPMLISLVAMNYHFVGDDIAGSVLGGIVAAWAVRLGSLSGFHPGLTQRAFQAPETG